MRAVWKDSRDATPSSAGAAGIDRVQASVFSSSLRERIQELRTEIRAGTFRFQRLRMAPVKKPSGGYRIIAIPTVRDRLVQRCLLRHLELDPRFNATSPISYGFTKGRTLPSAQRRALELRQEHPWVLQADIVKFFDQIPRLQVKDLIRKRVRSKIIADLLCKAVDCELEDGGGHGAKLAQDSGIQKGRGLRQGMPVSPLLSNLLLKGFDDQLSKHKIVAIRYADDLAIFADSKKECEIAFLFVKDILEELSLKIPDITDRTKTILAGPTTPIQFLGVDIKKYDAVYKLCAPSRRIKDIEEKMTEIAKIDRCVVDRRNLAKVVSYLDSFIVGHSASLAVLAEDERKGFVSRLQSAKEKCLNSFLTELLGRKAVANLDDSRRAILGLQQFKI